jgi:hypothetical protein
VGLSEPMRGLRRAAVPEEQRTVPNLPPTVERPCSLPNLKSLLGTPRTCSVEPVLGRKASRESGDRRWTVCPRNDTLNSTNQVGLRKSGAARLPEQVTCQPFQLADEVEPYVLRLDRRDLASVVELKLRLSPILGFANQCFAGNKPTRPKHFVGGSRGLMSGRFKA